MSAASAVRGRGGAALLLAAWAALSAPMLFGQTLWFRDLLIYTYPQKSYVLERFLRGELPWWCERWGTGRPFFAMVQPGVFDPLNALLLLPHPLNLDAFNLAHLLVMMLGARAWLRALGGEELDASAGALMLGLSGYVVSMHASNGSYAWGVAFVPWCLTAVTAALSKRDWRGCVGPTLGVAAAVSLGVLAGDPLTAVFAGVGGLTVALSADDAGARRRGLGALVAGAVLAGLLCAVQLVPAVELSRLYRQGGVTMRDADALSLHPRRMAELVVPDALGQPFTASWSAPGLYTRRAQQRMLPLALSVHQGVLLIPLAALALAAFSMAWGRFGGPWPWMFTHVPGVAMFRGPEKCAFLGALALAALAARGLPEARRAPRRAALGALLLGVGLAIASRVLPQSGALRGAGWALGYAAVLGVAAWERVGARLAAALPMMVLACELSLGAAALLRWAPAEAVYRAPPLMRALAADRGGDPRGALVFRDLLLPVRSADSDPMGIVASLMPNHAMRDGVRFLDSYDALRVVRIRSVRREVARAPGPLLRAWGATHAIVGATGPLPSGLTVLAVDAQRGVRLARVEGAAPALFLARESVSVRGPEAALRAMESPTFRPGETAAVEGEPRAARGRCVPSRATAERREFACVSDAPGWMHVAEAFDPAWRAEVNGARARVARSAEIYLAVAVPAGASTVVISLQRKGLGVGGALSGLGCVAVALLLTAARRERSRRGGARGSSRRTHGGGTAP